MEAVGGFALGLIERIRAEWDKARGNKKALMRVGITAFAQVCFVAMNTVFVAQGKYSAVAVTSMLINFTWVLNVRRAVIGTWVEIGVYCTSAASGCLLGTFISHTVTGG